MFHASDPLWHSEQVELNDKKEPGFVNSLLEVSCIVGKFGLN